MLKIADVKKDVSLFKSIDMKVPNHHTRCPNPDHGGSDSVSTSLNSDGTILWHCHACNAGGTVIDAYQYVTGSDFGGAIAAIELELGNKIDIENDSPVKKEADFSQFQKKDVVEPTHEHVAPPIKYVDQYGRQQTAIIKKNKKTDQFDKYEISDATYITVAPFKLNGRLRAECVIRWDVKDEDGKPKKELSRIHYDGREWRPGKSESTIIPIYKMDAINSESIVVVVEGEKCMVELQRVIDEAHYQYSETFPAIVVTSLIGGSNVFEKSHIEVLSKAKYLWMIPDNDDPGKSLAEEFKKKFPEMKIIDITNQKEKPVGYDVADWIKENNDVRLLFRYPEIKFGPDDDAIQQAIMAASFVSTESLENYFRELAKVKVPVVQRKMIFETLSERLDISVQILKDAYKEILQESSKIDYDHKIATITLKETYDGKLYYISRNYWRYTGTHWTMIPESIVHHSILEKVQKYVPEGVYSYTKALEGAKKILKAMCANDENLLHLKRVPPPIINFRNGELHISMDGSIELKKHNPKSGLTFCLDVDYDENATCPEYDKMVSDIFLHNTDLIRHWHEVAGYIIQPVRDFKAFFMAYGPKGNNGKTTLFKILTSIIGDEAVASVDMSQMDGSERNNAKLIGKILMLDDDLKKDTHLNDGFIKTISEQKLISARYLYGEAIQFTQCAAPVMLCNHLPSTNDLSEAMFSRAVIIPFNAYFDPESPETDRGLSNRIILNELSGVINHFIRGYQRLRQRNGWEDPQVSKGQKQMWMNSTNTFYYFVNTQLTDQPGNEITCHQMREKYVNWCNSEGIPQKYIMQNRSIRKSLEELGMTISGANNNVGGWKVEDITFQ